MQNQVSSLRCLFDVSDCGPQEEDELYENHIVDTNMVYKLEKNKLVPVEEYWGNQPKYEMLKPDQVISYVITPDTS